MNIDIRVAVPNMPGAVMKACATLGDAGVNIDAFCGDLRPGESWGYLHFLVTDADKAIAALEGAGYEILSRHDVDVLKVGNEPGTLAEAVGRYSGDGRNIEVLYMASNSQIVIGTEDMQQDRLGVRMKDARY